MAEARGSLIAVPESVFDRLSSSDSRLERSQADRNNGLVITATGPSNGCAQRSQMQKIFGNTRVCTEFRKATGEEKRRDRVGTQVPPDDHT